MSTGERANILDYLPPEEKQKVITLVQRLKEETEIKDKYIAMYQQSQRALDDLTLKYNQLKDENQHLKQQIHNSFSIVSQVRAQFHANKQKNNHRPANDDEEWEDQEEPDNEENYQNSANQTAVASRPPIHHHKSPISKYRPPMTTNKKSPNILNLSTTELNNTNLSGSRGKEIEDLRKEVRIMQDEKRRKQEKERSMKEKLRLVDQIKNRYKNGDEVSQHSTTKAKQKSVERIDISDTFEDREAKTLYSHEKQSHYHVRSSQKLPASHRNKQHTQEDRQEEYRIANAKDHGKEEKGKCRQSAIQKVNGYVITADDYSDVLDMINGYD